MPAGRPTKYSEEVLEITEDYIQNFRDYEDVIPSIAGLAVRLGTARETLHVWRHEEGKERFSNMLSEMLAKQEQVLLSSGLSGAFNSNICKLVLAKHNYSDKIENTVRATISEDPLSDEEFEDQYGIESVGSTEGSAGSTT